MQNEKKSDDERSVGALLNCRQFLTISNPFPCQTRHTKPIKHNMNKNIECRREPTNALLYSLQNVYVIASKHTSVCIWVFLLFRIVCHSHWYPFSAVSTLLQRPYLYVYPNLCVCVCVWIVNNQDKCIN